jgi:hypothetical protein
MPREEYADEPIEIRAVLETSAVLSYARGHVHVGELLIDLADEGAHMGLPAIALLDAHARLLGEVQSRARLGVLAALPGIAVLALGADEATEVAATVPGAGQDLARAHAVWAALIHGAYYLTCETAPLAVPIDQVHHIPPDDA